MPSALPRWIALPPLVLIVVVSLVAWTDLLPPLTLPYLDKVGHFALFGLGAFGLGLAFPRRRPLAIGAFAAAMVVDEVAQSLVAYRTTDLSDLVADVAGITLAWVVAAWLRPARG